MPISVVPYAREQEPAVAAFNQRMVAGGSTWRFYETAEVAWLGIGQCDNARRDFYLAVDEAGAVHGSYCLKSQSFLLREEPLVMASIQGPISEGAVDSRFSLLAFQLMMDMQKREPRLFAWGSSDRMRTLLARLRWKEFRMPFFMRLVRVNRFLRLNAFLRQSRRIGIALDILAATGLGALGARLLQLAQRTVGGGLTARRVQVSEADRFGPWADEVWHAARSAYALIAIRDSRTMNALLPASGWPEATILRMEDGAETIGWAAVRDTQLAGDARFGDLRLGSIIDSLARPGREADVIWAATRVLERRGVDLVVANHTHPAWVSAFKASGFLVSNGRRPFILSPALAEILASGPGVIEGMHLTLLDGDGPFAL